MEMNRLISMGVRGEFLGLKVRIIWTLIALKGLT
jgi:hypothetical protein